MFLIKYSNFGSKFCKNPFLKACPEQNRAGVICKSALKEEPIWPILMNKKG